MRRFEGCGREVEAVQVAEVGLVAGGLGEGPVSKEAVMGVWRGAGGAENGGVPLRVTAGRGGGRARD